MMRFILDVDYQEISCIKELITSKKLTALEFYRKYKFNAIDGYTKLYKRGICKLIEEKVV